MPYRSKPNRKSGWQMVNFRDGAVFNEGGN